MSHTFTKTEKKLANHILREGILKYIGELWDIKSDGKYVGCTWDCTSPMTFDLGVWHLCQRAVHRGAVRASGRVEERDAGGVLQFQILFEQLDKGKLI